MVADKSELDWAWWQISPSWIGRGGRLSPSDAPGACSPLSDYFKPRLRLAKNVHRAQNVRFTFFAAIIREAFTSISTCRDPLDTSV
jgi:hypothetical protein